MNTALQTGETALWRAVVLQAFQDATFGRHGVTRRNRTPRPPSAEQALHAGAARAWLLGGGADFRRICLLAGLEPEAVRRSAQVAITASEPASSGDTPMSIQPVPKTTATGDRFSSPKRSRMGFEPGALRPANPLTGLGLVPS